MPEENTTITIPEVEGIGETAHLNRWGDYALPVNANRWDRSKREIGSITMKVGGREREVHTAKHLLDAAHQAGLVSIDVEITHVDYSEGFAVARAVATFADGTVFTSHGDASPESIPNEWIQPHFVRMAETRAIGRALGLALNADANASEEFGGGDSGGGGSKKSSGGGGGAKKTTRRSRRAAEPDDELEDE